jgi:hypothetical protein
MWKSRKLWRKLVYALGALASVAAIVAAVFTVVDYFQKRGELSFAERNVPIPTPKSQPDLEEYRKMYDFYQGKSGKWPEAARQYYAVDTYLIMPRRDLSYSASPELKLISTNWVECGKPGEPAIAAEFCKKDAR